MRELQIRTPAHDCMVDLTERVQQIVSEHKVGEGVCHVFVPHTTAGLTINENADPTVQSDMLSQLGRMVPWDGDYDHAEGNAAAHLKASLVGHSQAVLVSGGQLKLGTWQGIFLVEFDGPRTRRVWVQAIAD
jgi:secondary thiamine-phosphate synthase enzyme